MRATASARGVSDAELANLIRIAAGSNRIAEEKAAGQIEERLEGITEPTAQQALELIEMLHPAGDQREPVADVSETVNVDFGAFEPGAGRAGDRSSACTARMRPGCAARCTARFATSARR